MNTDKNTPNSIHPLALVDNSAKLGKSVAIAAYAIVEPNVEIGDHTRIASHAVIKQGSRLGRNNLVGEGAVIGGDPQDLSFDSKNESFVKIGDDNTIREGVTIHRSKFAGKATVVGDGNYLMALSHLAHDVKLHHQVVIANNTLLAGHVEVGSKAFVSGSCAVHQFARIGAMAMVGGLSAVSQDVPPCALAGGDHATFRGINAVGLRRAKISIEARKEVKKLYHQFFSLSKEDFENEFVSKHSHETRWQKLKRNADGLAVCSQELPLLLETQPLLDYIHAFLKQSQRGIIKHGFIKN